MRFGEGATSFRRGGREDDQDFRVEKKGDEIMPRTVRRKKKKVTSRVPEKKKAKKGFDFTGARNRKGKRGEGECLFRLEKGGSLKKNPVISRKEEAGATDDEKKKDVFEGKGPRRERKKEKGGGS